VWHDDNKHVAKRNLPDLPSGLDCYRFQKGDKLELEYEQEDFEWVNGIVVDVNYTLRWIGVPKLIQWVWLEPLDEDITIDKEVSNASMGCTTVRRASRSGN